MHAIASLNHPNVCTLHDVGADYLVMELVEGPTLADRIAEGPLPLEEALPIARQICDALEAAQIDVDASGVRAHAPRELFFADTDVAALHSFDATGDDMRFLILQSPRAGVAGGLHLNVLSNWQASLSR